MTGLVPFNRRNTNLLSTGFEDFYNMLDDFFSDNLSPRRSLVKDTFKINVQENDTEYFIEAELPGVNKEEIEIDLTDGRLSISVKKEENLNEEKKNYIHRESRYSSMSRSIYLADAENKGIKAKLDNGVLNISIPRQEKFTKTAKIEIE
ncbi:Hsp20/alpha crystallin family protein [Anoxybacterium hadale]|uniref:Hsp20/alpha crystallin family protein n=1 Tax=Anoxybacterium hadale TaxID=3408580 RepID=A0ACD1A6V3_9FIRM|nr:Hsp20/alpha crystallin family protein [Clostridiales bacterium]